MTIRYKCPLCGEEMENFHDVQDGTSRHVCYKCKKCFRIYELVAQSEM